MAARRSVAGLAREGRHVDRGAAKGPGVRVGGASAGAGSVTGARAGLVGAWDPVVSGRRVPC